MKSIVVHSYKGGVGKTTVALILAKHAVLTGKQACVLDFDFIGSGMSDLYRLRPPHRYLDYFFTAADPEPIAVSELLGEYNDEELGPRVLPVILNLSERPQRDAQAERDDATQTAMLRQLALEDRFHEIELATKLLLSKLQEQGFEMAVFDCHPGLGFVSAALRGLADLNVYVTTPNRSDCLGLLKAINLKQLDDARSFLILNMAEPPLVDLPSFHQGLRGDAVGRLDADVIISWLQVLGKNEEHFAVIPESDAMRRQYHLGSSGFLPVIGGQQGGLNFGARVLALL